MLGHPGCACMVWKRLLVSSTFQKSALTWLTSSHHCLLLWHNSAEDAAAWTASSAVTAWLNLARRAAIGSCVCVEYGPWNFHHRGLIQQRYCLSTWKVAAYQSHWFAENCVRIGLQTFQYQYRFYQRDPYLPPFQRDAGTFGRSGRVGLTIRDNDGLSSASVFLPVACNDLTMSSVRSWGATF